VVGFSGIQNLTLTPVSSDFNYNFAGGTLRHNALVCFEDVIKIKDRVNDGFHRSCIEASKIEFDQMGQ
jgi:hypothetical protein